MDCVMSPGTEGIKRLSAALFMFTIVFSLHRRTIADKIISRFLTASKVRLLVNFFREIHREQIKHLF